MTKQKHSFYKGFAAQGSKAAGGGIRRRDAERRTTQKEHHAFVKYSDIQCLHAYLGFDKCLSSLLFMSNQSTSTFSECFFYHRFIHICEISFHSSSPCASYVREEASGRKDSSKSCGKKHKGGAQNCINSWCKGDCEEGVKDDFKGCCKDDFKSRSKAPFKEVVQASTMFQDDGEGGRQKKRKERRSCASYVRISYSDICSDCKCHFFPMSVFFYLS